MLCYVILILVLIQSILGAESPVGPAVASQSYDSNLPPSLVKEIIGTIPSWLQGHLIRNGPANWEFQEWTEPPGPHWFMGLAKVHSIAFFDGQVTHAAQFIQSTIYNQSTGRPIINDTAVNTDVTIRMVDDVVLACGPNLNWNAIDMVTAKTIQAPFAFSGAFSPHSEAISPSHAQSDPRGNVVFLLVNMPPKPSYQIAEIPTGSRSPTILANSVPVNPAFNVPFFKHSFSLTENYVIIVDCPVTYPKPGTQPYWENFGWFPQFNSTFHIADRKSGNVVGSRVANAFFMFHTVNAYEDDTGNVILDLVSMSDISAFEALYLSSFVNNSKKAIEVIASSRLHRFSLPIQTNNSFVEPVLLSNYGVELPTIRYPSLNTQFYQYAYMCAVHNASTSVFLDSLLKVDVTGTSNEKEWHEELAFPGEPIFVAHPDSLQNQTAGLPFQEDDGVVISIVFDAKRKESFVLILDGSSFLELARVYLGLTVDLGFHGRFFR